LFIKVIHPKFTNQYLGNINNGVRWISNDANGNSLFGALELDLVSEADQGSKNPQQYSIVPGLHVTGPVVGGLKETGAISTAALATPTAPVITNKGTAGGTSYSYFCVAHDATSTSVPTGATLPSAAGTTTTGNAALSATNYNQIQCGPQAGVYSWDVLKTNTSTSLYLAQLGYQVVVNDTGQSTAGYTPPARNSSADAVLAGLLKPGGFVFANIGTELTVNGQMEFCTDCTIASPCAGGGTGAIAKRLNGVNVCN